MIYTYHWNATTQVADGGALVWTIPGSVSTGQTTTSGTAISQGLSSGYPGHLVNDTGGAMPPSAAIVGIQLLIACYASSGTAATDTKVTLLKNGAVTANRAANAYLGTVDRFTTYGSSTDLWGATWTQSDLNAISWEFQFTSASTGQTVYVDGVEMVVYTAFPSNNMTYLPGLGIGSL